MEERINGLRKKIQAVLPLLIMDQWQEANEQLPAVFDEMRQLIRDVTADERLMGYLGEVVDCLRNALWCMQVADSIQLADVLAYDMGLILDNCQKALA